MTKRLRTIECPHCQAKMDLSFCFDLFTVRPASDEPWRDIPIEDLELSIRSINVLRSEYLACVTAGDIAALSDGDILRTPNAGRKTLYELREAVENAKKDRSRARESVEGP